MLTNNEILETVNMLDAQNLDVRTVTMAISLLDCIDSDGAKTAQKVYDKVVSAAKELVSVCNAVSRELGIPIVNKRISVTPISLVGASSGAYVQIAQALDRAAVEIGVDFAGGYTALVHKGMTEGERAFINSIPQALASTSRVCASVNVASSKSGINMDAVALLGEVIKELSQKTENSGGCARLVVFCNAVEDNPFMAGAFNGTGEGDRVINVGVSGPGVVCAAVAKEKDADIGELCETIKKTAFKITRMGQLVAKLVAKRLGASFGIVDLSLAPSPKAGDSVAGILEEMGLEAVGTHGTTACLAMLNDAVKKGGVMASGCVGGLSGAFIPVSEDILMAKAAGSGALSIDKLEAMTAVCSVGLDMVVIPGDTPAHTIAAIIADECAIGMINNKTTAARLIPAYGKKAGERIFFGGLLGEAPVMEVNRNSARVFIERGGRIPAPIHSNKN